MKLSFAFLLLCSFLLACNHNAKIPSEEAVQNERSGRDNLAYKWAELALIATARDTEKFKPRPTITSRYLALIFVSVFDAWTCYDTSAIPIYLKDIEKRPENERNLKNKEIAISFAAFRTMNEYYYSDRELFSDFMIELGLDPMNKSLDPTTPEGIGNLAAKAVIEARKGDGSNQYGEENESNGRPYYDYTQYHPVNSPDNNVDQDRWQPKYFADGEGGFYAPACLTPYWQNVKPIGLARADMFRPGPPPLIGSEELKNEVQEVVDLQANLSDEQKALVEFMRDGPQSVQQAGHWLHFAQDVSRRDKHSLDQDVKMYFYVQLCAMDAFIACWDAKMYYDSARPFALVHYYFGNDSIMAWGGEGKTMMKIIGSQWRPYSPETFLCPPFPSYVSGHSSISGACSEALKLWTGSDEFGESVSLVAGALTEPDHLGDTVTLEFPTFTETAEMAGISRVMGGYHIQSDNIEGLRLGRAVAREDWNFYQEHLKGIPK